MSRTMHYTIALSLLSMLFVHVRTVNQDVLNMFLDDDILTKTNNQTEDLDSLINACPTRCSCILKLQIVEVNCSARNLSSIPIPGNNFQSSACYPITLMISNNDISELMSRMFHNFSTVESIVASLNKMKIVDVEAFSGLVSLRYVDLSDNIIKFIHPDTFKNNLNLEALKLSGNVGLQVLESTPFLNAPNLKHLYLSNCKLSLLSENTFSNLKNLITLDLSFNNLKSLSLKTISQMENLEDVDLSNNHWMCASEMQALFDWISERKGRIQSLKPIRCFEDNGRMRKLWSVSNRITRCFPKRANNCTEILKIAPESSIVFENESSVETSGEDEKAMVFGGLTFLIQHNLDSVYAIIIVVVLFITVIVFVILLTKRVMRNHARNLEKSNNNQKHNLTLSFGNEIQDKRSSFAPLLAPNSPTNEGFTTPDEVSDNEQPPSLYYEYINSTPEHLYEIIR